MQSETKIDPYGTFDGSKKFDLHAGYARLPHSPVAPRLSCHRWVTGTAAVLGLLMLATAMVSLNHSVKAVHATGIDMGLLQFKKSTHHHKKSAKSPPTSQPTFQPTLAPTSYPTATWDLEKMCQQAPVSVVGRPTDKEVTVNIMSAYNASAHLVITLKDDPHLVISQTDPFHLQAEIPQVILLEDLDPSTQYDYTIQYKNGQTCAEQSEKLGRFSTQRMFDEPFNFMVTADTHWFDEGAYEPDAFYRTMAQAAATAKSNSGLDLMLDLGDTFMGAKVTMPKEGAPKLYTNMFRLFSTVASSAALYLVNGNHDGEKGYMIPYEQSLEEQEQSEPVYFASLRKKYFPVPTPDGFYSGNTDVPFTSLGQLGNYYAFDWGNSLFVTLDPYWYTVLHSKQDSWEWTLGKVQYDWLHETLSSSKATFKFVFIHQYVGGVFGTSRGDGGNGDERWAEYFEWGGNGPDHQDHFETHRVGWEHGPIHQMLVENGVSVVFRGHDHLWHQGEVDGVIYNTVPKTSQSAIRANQEEVRSKGYNPAEVTVHSGHTLVSVGPDSVIVTFKHQKDGSILHQYNISAPHLPSSPPTPSTSTSSSPGLDATTLSTVHTTTNVTPETTTDDTSQENQVARDERKDELNSTESLNIQGKELSPSQKSEKQFRFFPINGLHNTKELMLRASLQKD